MRTFIWGPREWGENCSSNVDHSHICISSPQGRNITPKCGRSHLNLFFHDLDPEAIRRTKAFEDKPEEGEELIRLCFTEEHARSIVEFVKMTPEDTTIRVNCEAGISRSAGVVVALRRFFGGDVEEVFEKAIPNIHVASVVGRILRT